MSICVYSENEKTENHLKPWSSISSVWKSYCLYISFSPQSSSPRSLNVPSKQVACLAGRGEPPRPTEGGNGGLNGAIWAGRGNRHVTAVTRNPDYLEAGAGLGRAAAAAGRVGKGTRPPLPQSIFWLVSSFCHQRFHVAIPRKSRRRKGILNSNHFISTFILFLPGDHYNLRVWVFFSPPNNRWLHSRN